MAEAFLLLTGLTKAVRTVGRAKRAIGDYLAVPPPRGIGDFVNDSSYLSRSAPSLLELKDSIHDLIHPDEDRTDRADDRKEKEEAEEMEEVEDSCGPRLDSHQSALAELKRLKNFFWDRHDAKGFRIVDTLITHIQKQIDLEEPMINDSHPILQVTDCISALSELGVVSTQDRHNKTKVHKDEVF